MAEIDPKLKARVRNIMRKEWRRDRERSGVLKDARVARGQYMCANCKTLHSPKEVDVDHIEPVTPLSGYVDLETEAIEGIIEKIKSDPESDCIKANEMDLWEKVKETTIKGRRTGLGITGLGDCIAMLNARYGSEESLKIVKEIF